MGFDWIAPKNYKRHYICLSCQKGFKRPSKQEMKHVEFSDMSHLMDQYYASDLKLELLNYIDCAYNKSKVVCPHCEGNMNQVHYNFEVPAQRNNKVWKTLRESLSKHLDINYTIYIDWHHKQLQKTPKGSESRKLLKHNLATLEKKSKE